MYCVFLPINGGSSSRWQDRIEGSVAEGAALARHTTYRVGGPAKYLVVPATTDDVREVFVSGEDTFVMGAGSNVLVADAGFDGVVLKICNTMAHISVQDGEVVVGAGRLLPSLVNSCVEMGLSGMEWAVGIPGTVGGAVCANAGAFGSATWGLRRLRWSCNGRRLVSTAGGGGCRARIPLRRFSRRRAVRRY